MVLAAKIEIEYKGSGLKNIEKLLKNIPKGVTVGVHSDAKDEKGGHVAMYASANEFGTERIPERPFMRSTFNAKKQKIQKMMRKFVSGFVAGRIRRRDKFLDIIGSFLTDEIKKRITSSPSWAVSNSPKTIMIKGSSVPLIDTGRLRSSITWRKII